MMAGFSPFTRRLVAISLLVFTILGALNFVVFPVANAVDLSLQQLDDSRFRHARLREIDMRPILPHVSPAPRDLTLNAPNRAVATQNFAALIAGTAQRMQIGLTRNAPLPVNQPSMPMLLNEFAVQGEETAVMTFLSELERGRPLVRLKTWSLTRVDGQPGLVRLEAVAQSVWSNVP